MNWDTSDLINENLSCHNTKIDRTSGDIDYIGKNSDPSATDTASDWVITKFTRVGGEITQAQKKRGKWSDRATLF